MYPLCTVHFCLFCCEMAERQRAFVPTDESTSAMEIGNRGVNWTDDQTRQLIHLWSQKKIQGQLEDSHRNKHVFRKLAEAMTELGYERTWIQCREKIRNLRKDYKKVTDHNRTSGKGRKTCKFFKELDEILGCRPATRPTSTLDTSSQDGGKFSNTIIILLLLFQIIVWYSTDALCSAAHCHLSNTGRTGVYAGGGGVRGSYDSEPS